MGENQRDIYKELNTSQSKYIYFKIAVAASAIAFSVTRTQDSNIAWQMAPLGLAILCWGISFYLGCKYIRYRNSTLYANAEYLKVLEGTHKGVPKNNPQYQQAAAEGIRDAMESNSTIAQKLANQQFYTLIAGMPLFLAWHVWEMILRSC